MAEIKNRVGTRTALNATGLATLADATFVASDAVDLTTSNPLDLLVELAATPNGTVGSNQQAILYAKSSLDGTNYSTGPETGTTAADEENLVLVGTLQCNSNSTEQREHFNVAGAFGGVLPAHIKFVVKNETGVAFSAASIHYSEVTGEVV